MGTQAEAELDATKAVIDAAKGSLYELKSEVHWERGTGYTRTEVKQEQIGHAKYSLTRSLQAVVHSHTGVDTSRGTMSKDENNATGAGITVITVFPATGAAVRIDPQGNYSDLKSGVWTSRPDDVP